MGGLQFVNRPQSLPSTTLDEATDVVAPNGHLECAMIFGRIHSALFYVRGNT